MTTNKFAHKDYTKFVSVFQPKLPMEMDMIIPENDSVRLLGQVVEEMNLAKLYQSYSRKRKNLATPKQLLKVVVYGYMNGYYSSRQMEQACRRDINFMYLLEGAPAPDHSTIARFRSKHFASCSRELLAEMHRLLADNGELSLQHIFIDGTKIESVANRYTFVWKKAVTKNLAKLLVKIEALFQEAEEELGVCAAYSGEIHVRHLRRLMKRLNKKRKRDGIELVYGKGKRKTPLQRIWEKAVQYREKLREYGKSLHIAGVRNSYSKTDQDATFMRMKEDHMRNGQLKPAYNVQFGVDAEYVVWVTASHHPNDLYTLIPFLKEQERYTKHRYGKVIADAGYESEENYRYLEEHAQQSYIKPSNYEAGKTRKYRNEIGRAENMRYDARMDSYTCAAGKQLTLDVVKHRKSRSGYQREISCYSCKECAGCPLKGQCIKGNHCKQAMEERSKKLEVSKYFQQKRAESYANITSWEGIQLRMNRSIQSEGAFGELKANMGFRRFLCRKHRNVLAETILAALAHNVNKLHNKIQQGCCARYLFPLQAA